MLPWWITVVKQLQRPVGTYYTVNRNAAPWLPPGGLLYCSGPADGHEICGGLAKHISSTAAKVLIDWWKGGFCRAGCCSTEAVLPVWRYSECKGSTTLPGQPEVRLLHCAGALPPQWKIRCSHIM